MKSSNFLRSNLLVLGANSVQSLLPATLISQVEALLDGHRIEDAVELADERRKKLQERIQVDEDDVSYSPPSLRKWFAHTRWNV